MLRSCLTSLLILWLTLIPTRVPAGLPVALDGKPLPSLAPMLERAMPAVVNVSTTHRLRVADQSLLSDPFLRWFFGLHGQTLERKTQSLGSGVIIDADNGYILTNSHVIEKADVITVTLQDRRRLRARRVGTDAEVDIAVIQIPSDDLTALPLADSNRLRVGDFVVAIGNPFGLGQTVTSGIISALGRSGLGIEGFEDFIQTDASINPGNSGGALVNLRGELIGLNTAILSPEGGSVGIGFAIPVNMAKAVTNQLLEYGEVRRGYLGVQVQDLNPQLARTFNIKSGQGAVLTRVSPGSPADKAGLQPGHIIVAINERSVASAAAMRNIIGVIPVGRSVTLDIVHEAKLKRIEVVIAVPHVVKVNGQDLHPRFEGATLSPIDEANPLYEQVQGILVLEVAPNSPASHSGFRAGDVIRAVNRQRTRTLEALENASRGQDKLYIDILRQTDSVLVLLE